MPNISKAIARSIVSQYFRHEGWLPHGSNPTDWKNVRMEEMHFDDPPAAADPHFHKKKAAAGLQYAFSLLSAKLPSPVVVLKDPKATLGELADWCYDECGGGA